MTTYFLNLIETGLGLVYGVNRLKLQEIANLNSNCNSRYCCKGGDNKCMILIDVNPEMELPKYELFYIH